MEIQQLKGFYYSARLGSLTRAAEKMAITQSAVSQQIKALEEELGIKLFNRFGPRKDLTSDGRLFYNLITPLIQELDSLRTTFEDLKGTEKGFLTIAATTFMIMNKLPTVIRKFSNKYPHVRLTILERRWTEIVPLAQAGEIDFGLAPISGIPSNLNYIKLPPIKRVLICKKGHPLEGKKNVTLLDIAQYPVVTYEKGLVSRDEVDAVFGEVNLELEVVMEATNSETIKHYVETGIGVAIVPEMNMRTGESARIVSIPMDHYFGKSQYGVILRKGKHITSWVKNFLVILEPSIKDALGI